MPSVDVVLPLPFHTPFTYSVPDHLAPLLKPGARVLVPFRSRRVVGFVWGPGGKDVPAARLKPVMAVLDREPLVRPDVQRLCRWIAEYYFAPPGEALALAVPPQALKPADPPVRATAAGLARAPEGASLLKELAGRKSLPLSAIQGDADRFAQLELLLAEGLAAVAFSGRRVQAATGACALPDLPLAALRERCGRARGRAAVVDWLAGAGGSADEKAIRAATGVSAALIGVMIRAGLLQRIQGDRDYGLESHVLASPGTLLHPLTPAQAAAFAPVREAIERGGFAPFLLQGVTGSGKTEIYLHAVREVVERGGRALYLVPEIALTPAAAARLRALFPGRVSLFHSGLSEGERLQEFHRARTGEARIVMGTRSALFLPLEPLRLVVVDEEQETAYKQEESPRYHARDAALVRAKEAGAAVLLGSATPSMESLANADRGRYTLLTLDERVEARPLPRITVVDLRREIPVPGDHGRVLFSQALIGSLDRCFAAGDQAILLLNRRGWAPLLLCRLSRGHLALDAHSRLPSCHLKIVVRLQVEPVVGAETEIACQTQRGVRRHGSPALHDLAQAVRGYPERTCQLVAAHPKRIEQIVLQDPAGVRRHPVSGFAGHASLLMVAGDLDIVGIAVAPHKADSVLVVDADSMLSGAVSLETLQRIAGENRQVAQ